MFLSPSTPLSGAPWAARGHVAPGAHTRANATLSFKGPRAATWRAEIMSAATLMPESDDFASGNSIGIVGGTAQLTLDPANAYDNTYTVHYYVSVTING